MDTIKVSILKYNFIFRPLRWREEFGIKFDPKKDRFRTILSCALDEVSGLKIKSKAEAFQVLQAIPSPIIYRVFVLYKAGCVEGRMFTTVGLYKAPEPNRFMKKLEQAEEERETIMDRVEREMEAKFGRQELADARANEALMMANARKRGVVLRTPSSDSGE